MENVPGTTGYRSAVDRFIEATEAVAFEDVHKPFLELLNTPATSGNRYKT